MRLAGAHFAVIQTRNLALPPACKALRSLGLITFIDKLPEIYRGFPTSIDWEARCQRTRPILQFGLEEIPDTAGA